MVLEETIFLYSWNFSQALGKRTENLIKNGKMCREQGFL